MSYYEQRNRNRLGIGQDGNALTMLIAVNLIVFVLVALIKLIYFFAYGAQEGLPMFDRQVMQWITLPAHLPTFITRPWTLLTHFILHEGVWHLVANMIWLWSFGYLLQSLARNNKIIPIFIYGAMAGAVMYIITYNLIPGLKDQLVQGRALGASAGVMAIAIATTVIAPNYRIFPMINGGIPLWVITLIFVIIDLATIPYNNPGGHIAHLAGAGMGFLFVTQLRRGNDWSTPINNFFDWVNNLFNPDKPKRGKTAKSQYYYKATVPPYKKTATNLTQQRIDDILDKINQKGYSSLTQEEKDILSRASEDDL